MGDKLRVLAVSGKDRVPAFANAPSFTELGVGQIGGLIYSLNVAAGIPKAAFEHLQRATSQALSQPDARAAFAKQSREIVNSGPEGAARLLESQAKLFAEVVSKAGIKLD